MADLANNRWVTVTLGAENRLTLASRLVDGPEQTRHTSLRVDRILLEIVLGKDTLPVLFGYHITCAHFRA